MEFRELAVPGAYAVTPRQHGDDRGVFFEAFRADLLARHTGRRLDLLQANTSISSAGVVRGVHWTDVTPGAGSRVAGFAVAGQAKYVTCPRGRALDAVVDLRVGSPTFGTVDVVELEPRTRRGVWIPEGLGHAFIALEDDTTLVYLCSATYDPAADRTVTPADPALSLPLPDAVQLSPKDEAGPSLADAAARGLLPRYEDCQRLYAALAG